jgi:Flp pilus assembly pilin Flp
MAALIALVIFGAVAALGTSLFESYECTGEHVSQLTDDPRSVTC